MSFMRWAVIQLFVLFFKTILQLLCLKMVLIGRDSTGPSFLHLQSRQTKEKVKSSVVSQLLVQFNGRSFCYLDGREHR